MRCRRRRARVPTEGDWEAWIAFFLEAVGAAAGDAERNVIALTSLVAAEMTGQKKNRYQSYVDLL